MDTLQTQRIQLDLEAVRSMTLRALAGRKARVYLFGSQASGAAGRKSDIDVAILPLELLPRGLLSALRQAFEDSNILATVDLFNLLEVEPSFRARVESEGVLWSG